MGSEVPVFLADHFIGEIRIFAHDAIPTDWLPCDGRSVAKIEYQALFYLIGYKFGGSGDQFQLPDLRGRVALGTGPSPGQTVPYALGDIGGAEKVTLTIEHIPQHRHSFMASTAKGTSTDPAGRSFGAGTGGGGSSGSPRYTSSAATQPLFFQTLDSVGGMAHENMQPHLVLRHCIAVLGKYVRGSTAGAR